MDVNAISEEISGVHLAGKTVVIRKSALGKAWQEGDRRFKAEGGFGCSPTEQMPDKKQNNKDRTIPSRRDLLDREHERVNDELIRQAKRAESASQAAREET